MITYIEGSLLEKNPSSVVVKTGGVGFFIEIPFSTFYELPETGSTIGLYIHTQLREDSIRLFGFKTLLERQLFLSFLSVSRIGPKLALTILSGTEIDQLIFAIQHNSSDTLASIPGIGKKSAERILFELQGKTEYLKEIAPTSSPLSSIDTGFTQMEEVLSILENLGYKRKDAEQAIRDILVKSSSAPEIGLMIRESLRILSGRG